MAPRECGNLRTACHPRKNQNQNIKLGDKGLTLSARTPKGRGKATAINFIKNVHGGQGKKRTEKRVLRKIMLATEKLE